MEIQKHLKRTSQYQICNRTIKQPRLFPTKPQLEKQRADEEQKRINDTKILEEKFDERPSTLKISDYKMLNSNTYINDILVEFYLNYWYTQKLNDLDKKRTYVFNTHFYTALTKSFNASDYPAHYTHCKIRHERVKRWTKKINVFKKDFIFIPIFEKDHWFMAVVCFPHLSGKVDMKDGSTVHQNDNAGRYEGPKVDSSVDDRIEADPNGEDLGLFNMTSTTENEQGYGEAADKKTNEHKKIKRPCILIFDSLSGGVHRARITATLRGWLEHEYNAKYPNGPIKDFSPEAIKGALLKVPQQPNSSDCGLFLMHYFKMFFERPIVDYTLPIRQLENWFSVDEVSKNCQKRKELQRIILTRMIQRRSILPAGIKLPILDLQNTML